MPLSRWQELDCSSVCLHEHWIISGPCPGETMHAHWHPYAGGCPTLRLDWRDQSSMSHVRLKQVLAVGGRGLSARFLSVPRSSVLRCRGHRGIEDIEDLYAVRGSSTHMYTAQPCRSRAPHGALKGAAAAAHHSHSATSTSQGARKTGHSSRLPIVAVTN